MKTLFCHVSHEKTLAVSNTFLFPHNVKSFQDESLNIDHRSIIAWIITNIPMILCFQNGGGHRDVAPRCTSPVIPFLAINHNSIYQLLPRMIYAQIQWFILSLGLKDQCFFGWYGGHRFISIFLVVATSEYFSPRLWAMQSLLFLDLLCNFVP